MQCILYSPQLLTPRPAKNSCFLGCCQCRRSCRRHGAARYLEDDVGGITLRFFLCDQAREFPVASIVAGLDVALCVENRADVCREIQRVAGGANGHNFFCTLVDARGEDEQRHDPAAAFHGIDLPTKLPVPVWLYVTRPLPNCYRSIGTSNVGLVVASQWGKPGEPIFFYFCHPFRR